MLSPNKNHIIDHFTNKFKTFFVINSNFVEDYKLPVVRHSGKRNLYNNLTENYELSKKD